MMFIDRDVKPDIIKFAGTVWSGKGEIQNLVLNHFEQARENRELRALRST